MTNRAELTSLIGKRAVEALIAWRPGGKFRVPKNPARIAHIIGERAAAKLCSTLAWQAVYIPSDQLKKVGYSEVAALVAAGLTDADIAKILGCSSRTVTRAKTVIRRRLDAILHRSRRSS